MHGRWDPSMRPATAHVAAPVRHERGARSGAPDMERLRVSQRESETGSDPPGNVLVRIREGLFVGTTR